MFWHSSQKKYPRYVTIEKQVGETPLVAAERMRAARNIPSAVPLAYAGRLDPMASGTLLILIGDECKKQTEYHTFDKEYRCEILLGASSDSGDVLGLLRTCPPRTIALKDAQKLAHTLVGSISLPYPHFSSKTVHGKPLHMWTLENRLNEITVPVKESRILSLTCTALRTVTKSEVLETVRRKIETIPPVTDTRKALGADFRRDAVRASWDEFAQNAPDELHTLSFTCVATSGTYMRSLSGLIAQKLGSCGLAYSIHRTKIGRYYPLTKHLGIWYKKF